MYGGESGFETRMCIHYTSTSSWRVASYWLDYLKKIEQVTAMIWPFLLTVHIWKATSHSTAPTFLVSFTSHSHFVCSHRIVKDFGGTWKWYTVVSCPDPFRKNREGVWQHCHTTVCPARSVKCAPMRLQSSVCHVNRFVTDLCTRWCCAVWQSSDHVWCCWEKEWDLKSCCWSKRR